MKKYLILILALTFFLGSFATAPKSFAQSESSVLGSSVVQCDEAVYVEHIKVEDPTFPIIVHTDRPVLSGCTDKNIQLTLTLNEDIKLATVVSGIDGSWSFKPDSLKDQVYRLYIAKDNFKGGIESATLSATFKISNDNPNVLAAATTNPNLFSWNYFSITFLISLILLLLLILYLITRRLAFKK